MEVDAPDEGITVEHRLRRLLHIGTVGDSLQLKGGYQTKGGNVNNLQNSDNAAVGGIKKTELAKIGELLQPQPPAGLTNLALQHCLAAMQHNNLVDKRALFLVLSAILKIDCRYSSSRKCFIERLCPYFICLQPYLDTLWLIPDDLYLMIDT